MTSAPTTSAVVAPTTAGRSPGARSYASSRAAARHFTGRMRTSTRNAAPSGTRLESHGLTRRMEMFASTLRTTTCQASPSRTCWTNRPRCVGVGRVQSTTARTATVTAPSSRTATSRRSVTRIPASVMASSAKPGTIAMTPPKSAPRTPITGTATSPAATATSPASLRRPRRTSGCATTAVAMVLAAAKSANGTLPKP
ncbi:hypothetical protein D5H78_13610 [Vallicoccus soli]|uniref:Uncharacterized protein n=1 Tax=Vallicoccus soli TaxID=2339232 RepID=A0A3A3Z307_9ACTN|nr:hypothetical protein D5H78_13610 [Vallicoccus soli]